MRFGIACEGGVRRQIRRLSLVWSCSTNRSLSRVRGGIRSISRCNLEYGRVQTQTRMGGVKAGRLRASARRGCNALRGQGGRQAWDTAYLRTLAAVCGGGGIDGISAGKHGRGG
jgi:hypothetical protein